MKKINKKKIFMLLVFLLVVGAIIFMVFDNPKKSKSTKKQTKKVVKKEKSDNVKPEIKLKGKEEMTIVLNGAYDEMGATASDNIDGDITDKIKIKNNVKLDTAGEYTVDYTVSDKDDNKTTVKRKVKVINVENKDTDGVAVLMYHYFYNDENGETGKDGNYTAKTKFEEQLKYLKENDYYFPSMKDIRLYVDGKIDLPEKSVVITMDDGHEDNYTIAYPLAVKYKVPITMFVVTTWTDVSQPLQQEMINTGYVIMQSHTHNMHRPGCSGMGHGGIIQCINYNEGVNDLKESKKALNNSDSLAYPFGDNNESAQNMLKEAGFSLGFTTEYGKVKKGMNPYKLPRVRINGGIGLDSFTKSL